MEIKMTDQTRQRTTWKAGETLPEYANKATLAYIITHHLYPIKNRTIEHWPLIAHRPNRENVYSVEDALRNAKFKLKNAPSYKQASSE
jgi:hypothetical protein